MHPLKIKRRNNEKLIDCTLYSAVSEQERVNALVLDVFHYEHLIVIAFILQIHDELDVSNVLGL